jgi:hypothetical protein
MAANGEFLGGGFVRHARTCDAILEDVGLGSGWRDLQAEPFDGFLSTIIPNNILGGAGFSRVYCALGYGGLGHNLT